MAGQGGDISGPDRGENSTMGGVLNFLASLRQWLPAPRNGSAESPAIAPGGASASVKSALLSARRYFGFAGLFSGTINILMLSGSLFMLQVYDRVIPSHSQETLIALVILVIGLHGLTGLLEAARSKLFARIGRHVDVSLRDAAFEMNVRAGLPGGRTNARFVPFKDLDAIRTFLASGGPGALFDLPWTPLYVFLLFLLHPYLGCLGLFGIVALSGSTYLADRATSPLQKLSFQMSNDASALSDSSRQAAETLKPLGMTHGMKRMWLERYESAGDTIVDASDMATRFGGFSRFLRVSLQSITLAAGAYLVITGKATGGVMIASSILLGKALAPVELAISHWRGFSSARQAYVRLNEELASKIAGPSVRLPRPGKTLAVEGLYLAIPGTPQPLLNNLNFQLQAGDGLGILGASGTGKSTLIRALVGLWPCARGTIRIDGSTIDQWSEEDAGAFTGYLAQGVELFAGTVGANISRFAEVPKSEAIVAAAQLAGVDKLIRGMAEGFETDVGLRGGRLSAGQRQRVALARAVYGKPFLVVLDEPNSALDAEGEIALMGAIAQIRRNGGIVIVSAHKPSILQAVNKVLVLANGAQQAFGPRDEVLKKPAVPAAVKTLVEAV